jgi:polar amino acid transport system substrate-binding protein
MRSLVNDRLARAGVRRLILLGLLVSLSLTAGCGARSDPVAEIQEAGVLRVAVDPSFPPFAYIEGDAIRGLDADLARELAARLDVEAQLVTTNFDGLYDALTIGRADVIISALYPDPFRTEDFVFSNAYFNAGDVLVVPQASDVQAVADLAGRDVGVVFGTSGHMAALAWEETLPVSPTLVSHETAEALLDALDDGAFDVAVVDNLAARRAVAADASLRMLVLPQQREPYVIAARAEDAALIEKFNALIAEMEADGTLATLQARWIDQVTK